MRTRRGEKLGYEWTTAPLMAGVLASVALSGCAGRPAAPADIYVHAAWQAWQDDVVPHLILTIANAGEQTGLVGPGEREIDVRGPGGAIPLDWGETDFARPILPGQSVVVGFHPRHDAERGFVLSIDHASGLMHSPTPGIYTVCIEQRCREAIL